MEFGSTQVGTNANTTSTEDSQAVYGGFANRGVTNSQIMISSNLIFSNTSLGPYYGTVDTTASQTFSFQLELAAATDTLVLEYADVEVLPGVP